LKADQNNLHAHHASVFCLIRWCLCWLSSPIWSEVNGGYDFFGQKKSWNENKRVDHHFHQSIFGDMNVTVQLY